MSNTTLSSTQQQDRVAASNSSQMRRHSADHKASQGASAFAGLLQQASEPAETEADVNARELFDVDLKIDPQTQNAADWLALSQALNGGRGNLSTPVDATDSALAATRAKPQPGGSQPLATDLETTATDETLQGADTAVTADLAAEAGANAPPRRASAKATGAALAQALGGPTGGAGVGVPQRNDAPATVAAAVLANTPAATLGGAALPINAAPEAGQHGVRAALASEETGGSLDAPATGPDRLSAVRAEGGATQTDVQAGTEGQGGADSRSDIETPQPTDTPAWGERWGEAMDDVGHQVSYWLGRGVKQAQIQIDAGLERPMEVAVSFDNGQAVLHFQTDNPAARAAIEQGAADALRQALLRDGIGLAGLSVGSQGRQDQPSGDGQPTRPGWHNGRGEATATEGTPRPATRQSNRVLDLYA